MVDLSSGEQRVNYWDLHNEVTSPLLEWRGNEHLHEPTKYRPVTVCSKEKEADD